ncbi:MAG: DNA repair and recombination protein RadB [Candidatus Nanohaloarchaea archaeon]|nr:DNA repair and recombination protein RadB [Candidatus Nanohaloarchaea archaeon]
MEEPERLALGCDPLDEMLNGGIEAGVITNVYGRSGTGKTNVCIQAIVSCLNQGGKALFVDTEGGFSVERFLQVYDDREALERLVLMEPTSFEEQKEVFDDLEEVVEEQDIDLVVVDSLVALYRLRLKDEDASETNRELSRQLSILSRIARQRDIPVLVTNQVYSSFESEEVQMVGRDVPTYWSKCLIRLEESDNPRRAVLRKHRSRPEGDSSEFVIASEGLQAADGEPTHLF